MEYKYNMCLDLDLYIFDMILGRLIHGEGSWKRFEARDNSADQNTFCINRIHVIHLERG